MGQNTVRRMSPDKRTNSIARMEEKKRVRARQRRNKKIFCISLVVVLCILSFLAGRASVSKKEGAKGGGAVQTAAWNIEAGGFSTLSEGDGSKEEPSMTLTDMRNYVQSHPAEYPDYLRTFLENTPEATEFVFHYPEYKDQASQEIDLSGDYTKGEIPLLIQWDKRWGYETYGDDLIALSGCGPTCLSMVYVGLTGDTSMNPRAMAEFSAENGFYLENVGTSWELMSSGAGKLGLTWSNPGLSKNRIYSELDMGHPLILSMKPGDFTSTGHFIVICGRKGDELLVHDPNSPERSQQTWTYEELEPQIKELWSYSKGQLRESQVEMRYSVD